MDARRKAGYKIKKIIVEGRKTQGRMIYENNRLLSYPI